MNEPRYKVCIYNRLDGRVLFDGKESSEANSSEELMHITVTINQSEELWEINQLHRIKN